MPDPELSVEPLHKNTRVLRPKQKKSPPRFAPPLSPRRLNSPSDKMSPHSSLLLKSRFDTAVRGIPQRSLFRLLKVEDEDEKK